MLNNGFKYSIVIRIYKTRKLVMENIISLAKEKERKYFD